MTNDYYYYCPRCGYISPLGDGKNGKCPYCENKMMETDINCDFIEYCNDEEKFNHLIYKKYNIENNVLYDKKAVQKRKEQQEFQSVNNTALDPTLERNKRVTCPYCKSTNVSKISTAGRVVSVGLFGLGSSKIGKQFHCGNCKADF